MLGLDDTVLEASGVGKIFSRSQTETRERIGAAVRQVLLGMSAPPSVVRKREFWALKDIDLTLRRGEALGIIGLNGSGKTTLLRMLAGQIVPDAGVIRVWGCTASMIDLTAGFQTTASGRRNIYLRGAALGRPRDEMAESEAGIIAFAELGDAIDAPVATYSSGMKMRLAFAIMVASAPDILFIDEVLAVGDFRFRQKCLARLREIRERTSFVMVSHSMGDIRNFCTRVLVLHKGQLVFEGPPAEAVEVYESLQFPEPVNGGKRIAATLAPQFVNWDAIREVEAYWCDTKGKRVDEVQSGEPLSFRVSFVPTHTPRQLIIGVPVWTEESTYVTGFSTELGTFKPEARAGERAEFLLSIRALLLNPGQYVSNLSISDGPEFLYRQSNPPLRVARRHFKTWGIVTFEQSWSVLPETVHLEK